MQISTNINSKNLLKTQNLVKQYNWRFISVININSKHQVILNSNNNSNENINSFCKSFYSLDNVIVEKTRKYSLIHKIKIFVKYNLFQLISKKLIA
jgi:hypothetical protein